MKNKLATIVLGSGCFWCTEAVFKMIPGVISVMPGYAGGNTINPTYHQVCSGTTNHAEVIKIDYNPKKVKIGKILDVFFTSHDPTTLNRQGNDVGTQYRSIILYTTKEQKDLSEKYIKKIQKYYDKKIVTEVKMLDKFYPAESYHKNYYENNSNAPYCQLVISPKLEKIKKKFKL